MNDDKLLINNQAFFDGQSFDKKIGPKSSFAYSRGFDWRKNPSQLVQGMQPRRIDSGTITSLITNIVQASTGERFALDTAGNLYCISTTNTVNKIGSIGENGGFGLLYRSDTDTLYIAGLHKIHTYGPVKQTTTRKLTRDFLSTSESDNTTGSYPGIRSGGQQSYALKSALSELGADQLHFTSDIEPLTSLKLQVTDKGSGNWTVVVHDPLHRELATETVLAASMDNGLREFTFDTPVPLLVKPNARIYHVHVYSSNGTGTVASGNSNELDTADFRITADRFVSDGNGVHCMEHFLHYIAIQHGRYLALWEPLTDAPDNREYVRHKIIAPDNYDGCGLCKTDEYLVQAFRKVATDTSRNFQEGLLLFWDGLAKIGTVGSYNFYIEVKGTIQAIYTENNIPHIIVDNTLFVWLGGKTLTRVRDLPNTDMDFTSVKDNTQMYPYLLTSWRKMLHIGYPGSTTNEALEFGVYNYGSLAPEFDPSLGYQYQLSHGSRNTSGGTPLQIGCVAGFGDELYISWRKGTQYGLDLVDNSCKPASGFKVRMPQFDALNIHKLKEAKSVVVATNPIPSGTSVYLTYTLDDGTEVVASNPLPTGATQGVLNIDGERFHVIDYGLQGSSDDTVTQPLRVRAIALEWDPLKEEGLIDATA